MTEQRSLKTAVSLMRMALPLLDNARKGSAAARLQHAIDTALGLEPMCRGDLLEPDDIPAFLLI
ncbi:hypothetical protein GG804_22760 [Sphingomonas histidinilytica]|uniref:hypothetical protein n=1 Tax=Rhizorhabdus histidinilytica TaxID=439228 RepID=UPI001ADCF97C|nr:hypothetical protein [Rhizorhabdus histidinilytica]MBO9379597.1 hypothetical protein [Rhizorhabdus histidinilytica]